MHQLKLEGKGALPHVPKIAWQENRPHVWNMSTMELQNSLLKEGGNPVFQLCRKLTIILIYLSL